MMDLRDELEQLAGRPTPPTTTQLNDDLARGRSALRRRRTFQAAGGSLFAVAAAVAAISLSGAVSTPGNTGVQAGDRPAATAPAGGVELVAYKGKQPKGFTIDTVPDGYFVQSDDEWSLVMAPDKAKNPGPNVDPSKDPTYDPNSFEGKISVMLESDGVNPYDPGPGHHGEKKVKVGDADGLLVKNDPPVVPGKTFPANGDYGKRLFIENTAKNWLVIQFPEGLKLSDEQMIQLGEGVHVHKGAKAAAG